MSDIKLYDTFSEQSFTDCVKLRINEEVETVVQNEVRSLLGYISKLEENIGKTLIVECRKPVRLPHTASWPNKEVYIIGRISENPFHKVTGRLNSDGNVYRLDYDLRKGNYPDIIKDYVYNLNFFPITIENLVYPRQFRYKETLISDVTIVPIVNLTISDTDPILEYLENLNLKVFT